MTAHARAKGAQRRILDRGQALYPDLAPRLITWRNRGRSFVASIPPHACVLGVVDGPRRRPLRFDSSWRKLLKGVL